MGKSSAGWGLLVIGIIIFFVGATGMQLVILVVGIILAIIGLIVIPRGPGVPHYLADEDAAKRYRDDFTGGGRSDPES